MSNDILAQLTRTVLYEGYLLWPYRRSAIKNRQRWTFGGIYPQAFAAASGGADRSAVCADVLAVLPEGARKAGVDISLRFLHVVSRQVMAPAVGTDVILSEAKDASAAEEGLGFSPMNGVLRRCAPPDDVPVSELTVGDERYLSWDEATERDVGIYIDINDPGEIVVPISISAGRTEEQLRDERGDFAGAIVRSWQPIDATITINVRCISSDPTLRGVSATVRNDSPWRGGAEEREDAIRETLVSAHVVFQSDGAEFVSSIDPPTRWRDETARLGTAGLWPTLVGEEPDRHTLLASPIILGDYPRVAPESPGDLFDGGEIDQLLILNVLMLTEEEQAEMRDSDPRAREILERCRALSPEELMRLHATVRADRFVEPAPLVFNQEIAHERHLG